MGRSLGARAAVGASLESGSRTWLCQLDGTVHIHVGQLQSVNCDELCLPSDVNLECLGSALNDFEETFIVCTYINFLYLS